MIWWAPPESCIVADELKKTLVNFDQKLFKFC